MAEPVLAWEEMNGGWRLRVGQIEVYCGAYQGGWLIEGCKDNTIHPHRDVAMLAAEDYLRRVCSPLALLWAPDDGAPEEEE